MSDSSGWHEQAKAKLEKIVEDGCQRCGSRSLGLNASAGTLFLAPDKGTSLSGAGMDCALIICQSCAHVEMYSLEVLGISRAG